MVTVEVAIAGWFASTIIRNLIDKASSYFEDQKEWQSGMKDEVNRLSESRPKIETLVYAAESGDLRVAENPALKEWLGKLQDAVEEADIVLDELEYQCLKAEADGHPAGKLMKRIVKFGMRAVQQDVVLKRLREVVKTFDNLVASLGTFAQVLEWLDKHTAPEVSGDNGRETSSVFTENEFIGRENEKQRVIQWLKTSDKNISVFSIVGVGGVGKTALVQNIFDHPGVDFQIKMWVCVSTSFDEKVIIMKMLESLEKKNIEIANLEAAHGTLMEKITGKKFLLVLDDVWNDKEREKWNKVMALLKFGGEGSKILVTTRMESVADTVAKVVGEAMMFLNLNGLEDTDNLELLKKYAFEGRDPNEYPRLQSIGNNIAKKLRGIPLAVKVIGGMLNNKLEVKHWNRVLEDGALNSDNGTDGIKAAIRLSYEHLPPKLKPCFRYCGIFPQDYMFKREQLVDMWISVGLIPGDEKRSPEELASEFFETLVRKSFFEPKFSFFNMHDLLNELAQILSKNECLRVVTNDPIQIPQIPQSIRHLYLWTSNIRVIKNLSELKFLRTLLLFCNIEDAELTVAIDTALKGMKTIRYLQLSSKDLCVFPKSIGDLIHLRCLSITETKIPKLSPCLCLLYHLQILKFTINPSLHPSEQSIPADICKLSKLKRLDLPEDAISTIPHIGKLSSLQKLIGYSVKSEAGYDISELEMMSELCELTITNLENVKSTEEARKANLNSKQHLLCIALKWGHDQNIGGMNESEKEVADCLQPHKNLTDLSLNGYRATNLPNWLTPQLLPNLTEINIAHCSCLERLPPFGQLPYLKILILNKMGALKEISSEFYGSSRSDNIFPSLERLTLMNLVKLEEWREDTQSKQWFPRLKVLEVSDCKNLKKLPPIPTALKELRLYNLEIAILPEFKKKNEGSSTNQCKGSLSILHIFTCSKLTSLKSGFFMHPEELASLVVLRIRFCHNLVHLPSKGFRELISLKSLWIEECRRLILLPMLLPKNFFPPSVQRLVLNSCGDLAACLPQLLPDLSLLSFLMLNDCAKLKSLPLANELQSLTSLKELEIQYCRELESLGGLEAIPSLKVLKITSCDRLGTVPLNDLIKQSPGNRLSTMALDRLEVGKPVNLFEVTLKNLHLTKSVEIRGIGDCIHSEGIEKWLLQNGACLQSLSLYGVIYKPVGSLPNRMQDLKRLRVFKLHDFDGLLELPVLPRSLELLEIDRCSENLAGRLKEGGRDYDKISHINVVKVYGVKRSCDSSDV